MKVLVKSVTMVDLNNHYVFWTEDQKLGHVRVKFSLFGLKPRDLLPSRASYLDDNVDDQIARVMGRDDLEIEYLDEAWLPVSKDGLIPHPFLDTELPWNAIKLDYSNYFGRQWGVRWFPEGVRAQLEELQYEVDRLQAEIDKVNDRFNELTSKDFSDALVLERLKGRV